jgi:hypothetical protein
MRPEVSSPNRLRLRVRKVPRRAGYLTVELTGQIHGYAAIPGTPSHHNASVQVFAAPEYSSRVVWIADLLPNEMKAPIEGMINQGMAVMKKTLDRMSRSKQ